MTLVCGINYCYLWLSAAGVLLRAVGGEAEGSVLFFLLEKE